MQGEYFKSVMNDYIGKGKMPGMVTLILRHGKVAYFEAYGIMDIESKKPMTKDAIFRIASMTKAITSVGIMTLYEEGYFLLTDPVSENTTIAFTVNQKNTVIIDILDVKGNKIRSITNQKY